MAAPRSRPLTTGPSCTRCGWDRPSHQPGAPQYQNTCRRPFTDQWEPWLYFPDTEAPKGPWNPEDPLRSIFYLVVPGPRWTAVYGLLVKAGQLVVAEVRIRPTDTPGAYLAKPPEWSMDSAVVPGEGLTAREARIPFDRWKDSYPDALKEFQSLVTPELYRKLTEPRDLPSGPADKIDPTDMPRLLKLAKVAEEYEREINLGHRRRIYEQLTTRFPYTRASLITFVAEARDEVLLTPTLKRGVPGGRLTERALRILHQAATETPDAGGT
jgi:hypothetical protein